MRHGLIARVALLILWAAPWPPGAGAQSERVYGPTGRDCRFAPVTPSELASVESFFIRKGTVHQIEFGPAEARRLVFPELATFKLFCRELYGIPGRTRGLLNGILLEESLHIRDRKRGGYDRRQLEERALLLRLIKNTPFHDLAEGYLILGKIETITNPVRERSLSSYGRYADIVRFIERQRTAPYASISAEAIRELAKAYLRQAYPGDAEEILAWPEIAR